ncbi:MAG: NAD(P)-binding protein [Deltaproteobacteria bacterium]|nr:NAD(P)-binding protein [Deltaproteobacteria bacterium]
MTKVRYLIVGAGISGLAFADRVHDADYLVLEAADEIGGYCKTVVQDGFVWDYSGHFFHFRHPEIERELAARMQDQRIVTVVKDSRIRFADGYVDFPFQKNIHQLPREDFLACLVDLHFRDQAPPQNFREMLYARFGRGIAERFLVPYNEKLYATDLATLDAEAMGRFFPYADEDEIIQNFTAADNGSYNASFTYPEGGAIQYVHALASELDPSRIHTDEPVVAIDPRARRATTPKGEYEFEYLVSSVPFDKLLSLAKVEFDASIYSANQVEIFNLGFDAKGPRDVHWIYYPQRDLPFYRVGFYDNIMGTDRMSLYVEIGRPGDYRLDPAAVDATREQVLDGLRRAGVLEEQRLISSHHVVLDPAYVHITRASRADVIDKQRMLGSRGIYSLGRYGGWTYCAIEDNIVEARELAAALTAF